ncbi:MAG: chemotaxis protein CheW [Coriobacteriales bacterium]|nr:chemotaxis protein CheW [Coriobacteriales bacterium]
MAEGAVSGVDELLGQTSEIEHDESASEVGAPLSAEEVLRRRAESLATETLEEHEDDRMSLLVFRLGEEQYAVRVDDVREIFQEFLITPIPCVPDYISGVVNVRGEIVSVTDPARLMGVGHVDTEVEVQPPAIVVDDGTRVTALLVDEIGDIAEVPQSSVEPPVSTIDRAQAEFISGSVHVDGRMLGLLHVDRVLRPVTTGRSTL